MRIEILGPERASTTETCRFRILLINDSYRAATVSRNALFGPTLVQPSGAPFPLSVEATYGGDEEPLTLQPFTFYGRDREFSGLAPGRYRVQASYRSPVDNSEVVEERTIEITS